MRGTIRSRNRKKGQVGGKPTFGFIVGEAGEEFFFVPSSMQQFTLAFDDLVDGMTVEFTPIDADRAGKGRRAIEIKVIGAGTVNSAGPAAPPVGGH